AENIVMNPLSPAAHHGDCLPAANISEALSFRALSARPMTTVSAKYSTRTIRSVVVINLGKVLAPNAKAERRWPLAGNASSECSRTNRPPPSVRHAKNLRNHDTECVTDDTIT